MSLTVLRDYEKNKKFKLKLETEKKKVETN